MNKKVIISVIVPVYNAEFYIERCLNSIINQTYDKFELILIDDGSTDKSSKICDDYAYKDSRIRVIHNKNNGVSISRNIGIENAIGKFITFIDSDDYIDKDYLENLINNFNNGVLTCTNYIIETIVGNKNINNSVIEYNINEYISSVINGKILGTCWGKLFLKSSLMSVKFDSNTNYMEDSLFLIQYLLISSIKKIRFCETNYHYNCLNENSLTKSKKVNVLNRLHTVFYTLEKMNLLTNNNYLNVINQKKIRIVKKNIENVSNIDELRKIVDNVRLPMCCVSKNRIFLHLYIKKRITILFFVSRVKKTGKKILKIMIKKLK